MADWANGSELDTGYAFVADGFLYICVGGNLESNYNKATARNPERQKRFESSSGAEVDALYGPEDLAAWNYHEKLGYPGEYPFTRGVQPTMYRGRLWTMRQFAGFYNNYFVNQNGVGAGLLDSVSIDSEGFVVANFNNGDTQKLYKIPLAKFANPDGMLAKNGNIFIQTINSGEVNLKSPGEGGVGTLSPSSLEASNTELSEELTDMIVAQRAYQASSKVITTTDELLDDLNRAT